MIYALVNLIAIAVFLAITALPFVVLWRFGPRLLGFPAARWIAPAVAVAGVVCWAYASYQALRAECNVRPLIQTYARLSERPEGFELRGFRDPPYPDFGWNEAVDTGTVAFVDFLGVRYCKRPDAAQSWTNCPSLKEKRSSSFVNMLPPEPVHWWSPPLTVRTIEVRESGSERLLARAQDVVLGGGITGAFLRLFGGDQDYSFISCGYASRDIGPYRPSLSGRKRIKEYAVVDLKLIVEALP